MTISSQFQYFWIHDQSAGNNQGALKDAVAVEQVQVQRCFKVKLKYIKSVRFFSSSSWMVFCVGTQNTYFSFEVRADPDNTSLDGHLEGEADDPSDL